MKLKSMWMLVTLLLAGTLAPVNDAPRDKDFTAYLKKLRGAVAKRDPQALKKLVSGKVIVGGFAEKDETGWYRFETRWQPARADSDLWDVLGDFLDLGFFRESPDTFVSPYLCWKFPRELDPSQHLVVLRDALALRAKPDRDSPAVATLAFDVVRRKESSPAGGAFDWVRVETAAGQTGYVQWANVRSPLMARGQFSRLDGQWLLVALDRAQSGAQY
ncbi:MAG: SH3 domain-containing protein [Acidobacteriota bacterium]